MTERRVFQVLWFLETIHGLTLPVRFVTLMAAIGHAGPQPPCPVPLHMNWQIPDARKYRHGDYLPGVTSLAAVIPPPFDVHPQNTTQSLSDDHF